MCNKCLIATSNATPLNRERLEWIWLYREVMTVEFWVGLGVVASVIYLYLTYVQGSSL